MSQLAELIVNLVLIIAVTLLGGYAVRVILRRPSLMEMVSLGFPLGAGVLTFGTFLAAWAGFGISLSLVFAVYSLAVIVLVVLDRRSGSKVPPDTLRDVQAGGRRVEGAIFWLSIWLFVLLTVTAGYISVGRSHSNYDTAAMWAVKGYGIALEQDLFKGSTWGAHGLSYPLNIQLLVSFFAMTSGDRLPGSQLIFTVFQASALLACYAYWLRKGVRRWMAGLGLLFLASVPVIFLHGTIGFANLAMGMYMALGSAWGVEGLVRANRRYLLLGGLLLGLGSWTILEGILFTSLCVATLIIGWLWLRRPQGILWLVAPAAVVSGLWFIFFTTYGRSGSQAGGAVQTMLSSMASGDYNLVELRLIFGYLRRYLFHTEIWGLLFIVGPLLIALNWTKFVRSRRRDLLLLASIVIATGLLSCALYYLRSFVSPDFWAWLVEGFPRQSLGTTLLLGILVGVAAAPGDAKAPS
jgi:hypothetical protein